MQKRIKVVQSVIDSIGLKNACAVHGKIEDYFEQLNGKEISYNRIHSPGDCGNTRVHCKNAFIP